MRLGFVYCRCEWWFRTWK